MNSIKKISAVIIVRDAEQTIGQALESLKDFNEIILYDNGSVDKTLSIAGKFKNVKIIIGDFIGFGNTKNIAASFATNDWIFSIDSDELLSSRLRDSIDKTELNENYVYWFYRYNYYRKKRVKYSGWGKEKVSRLYNKKVTHFSSKLVHEGIEISRNLRAVKLKGEIMHYSYLSIADFVKKRSLYSDLFAMENQGSRKSSPFIALVSGAFAFLNTYIVRLAFLDGYRGMLIAVSNAHETFLKHIKLYEANLENNFRVSLIVTSSKNEKILRLALKSTLEQSILPNEIVVISTYNNPEIKKAINKFAEKSFIKVNVVEAREEANMAQLRNMAIAKAKHDYLIFVDGSSILHNFFIRDHIEFAKRGLYLQGDIMRLTKKSSTQLIEKSELQLPHLKVGNVYIGKLGLRNTVLAKFFGLFKLKKPLPYRLSNFSIFKSELIKLNGFDEDFQALRHCDADLLERLYISGIKRKTLRFTSIMYRFVGIGTGRFGKLRLDFTPNKAPKCKNGLDKYEIEKQDFPKLL